MGRKAPYLFSKFVIDGIEKPATPARILLSTFPGLSLDGVSDQTIIDETLDLAPSVYKFDEKRIAEYLEIVRRHPAGEFPLFFPEAATCLAIATSVIDKLWRSGKHVLSDLSVRAQWTWNDAAIGNMASFYSSIECAAAYIDGLELPLTSVEVSDGRPGVSFKVDGASPRRCCPATAIDAPDSWLVYIPFDNCDFRLGGSVLSRAVDARSALAPDISDSAYFIDCYEVVRELVEDKVVKAGVGVGEGGLAAAIDSLASKTGADVNVSGICNAYGEYPVRVLFSEVPGVLIQIDDADFDYVDAELLLQDIAYFPIGHPGGGSLLISSDSSSGLSSIIDSLLGSRASEGED